MVMYSVLDDREPWKAAMYSVSTGTTTARDKYVNIKGTLTNPHLFLSSIPSNIGRKPWIKISSAADMSSTINEFSMQST